MTNKSRLWHTLLWRKEILANHANAVYKAKVKSLLAADSDARAIGALASLGLYADPQDVPDRNIKWPLYDYACKEVPNSELSIEVQDHVVDCVATFCSYDFASDEEKSIALSTLIELLNRRPVSQLTHSDTEWEHVAPDLWQNVRRPTTYSRDGGLTWYDSNDSALNHGDTLADGVWNELQYGLTRIGARVRVKLDAYSGDFAVQHNGKTGRLVRFAHRLAYVQYDGTEAGSAVKHAVENLEELVS